MRAGRRTGPVVCSGMIALAAGWHAPAAGPNASRLGPGGMSCELAIHADLDDDGYIDGADLALLIDAWGPCASCPADLDGDDAVGTADLLALLASWETVFRLVDSPEDLDAIRDAPTASYRQVCDIDLAGIVFTPIPFFGGHYDGGGHAIANLAHDGRGADLVGLFGVTSGAAIVRDLALDGVAISGGSYVGALVGYAHGSEIDNVHARSGSVSGSSVYTGGLVGNLAGGALRHSTSAVVVHGDQYSGGLVGYNEAGAISDCVATGDVHAGKYSGALVGYVSLGLVERCVAQGDLIGALIYYGGGLAGAVDGGIIRSSTAHGNVAGYQTLGGAVGLVEHGALVEDCTAGGDVEGLLYAGGFAGTVMDGSTVRRCGASGDVTGFETGIDLGGFAGLVKQGSTVQTSYALGDVLAVQTHLFGGANGGGFVGEVLSATITDSYARGNVQGVLMVDAYSYGGFAGRTSNMGDSVVANCYATGGVVVTNGVVVPLAGGGVGGEIDSGDGAAWGLYWDVQASGLANGVAGRGPDPQGVTGLTTAQMADTASFPEWDFESVWTIDDATGYPVLRWQFETAE